jgi:hypothetical protein
MPSWRPRSPDQFPAFFRSAVEVGLNQILAAKPEGRCIIAKELTIDEATRMAERFRYFRWCIREHPLHRLANVEADYTLAVRTLLLDHKFALWLIVKPKVQVAELQKALLREAHAPVA